MSTISVQRVTSDRVLVTESTNGLPFFFACERLRKVSWVGHWRKTDNKTFAWVLEDDSGQPLSEITVIFPKYRPVFWKILDVRGKIIHQLFVDQRRIFASPFPNVFPFGEECSGRFQLRRNLRTREARIRSYFRAMEASGWNYVNLDASFFEESFSRLFTISPGRFANYKGIDCGKVLQPLSFGEYSIGPKLSFMEEIHKCLRIPW